MKNKKREKRNTGIGKNRKIIAEKVLKSHAQKLGNLEEKIL